MTGPDAETCAAPDCTRPRPAAPPTGGTRPRYCSETCRKRAYRARQHPATSAGLPAVTAPASAPLPWKPGPVPAPVPPVDPGRCPGCGGPLIWTPRGTRTACRACRALHAPPAVLAAHTARAGDRQVISQRDRDEAVRDLYGTVETLLDAIRGELDAGDLDPRQRGRLAWYSDELREARRTRDPARVAALETDLAGEDLGTTSYHGETIQGEIITDDDGEADTASLVLAADAMRRALLAAPNPAARFAATTGRQAAALPPGRPIPAAAASTAARPLQELPARSPQPEPGTDPVTLALAAGDTDPARLVALALGRDPRQPYQPPAGAPVRAARRITAPWRARRAITS